MNLGRFFAKGWIVALAIAPLAVAQHVNPQLSLERLVSPATASPAVAATPVTYKKSDIVAVSSAVKLDSQTSAPSFAPARPPIPEPYAWVLALGFLGFLILRRTRGGSGHAF